MKKNIIGKWIRDIIKDRDNKNNLILKNNQVFPFWYGCVIACKDQFEERDFNILSTWIIWEIYLHNKKMKVRRE